MAGRPSTKPKTEATEEVVIVEDKVDTEKEGLKAENEKLSKSLEMLQEQMLAMQKQLNSGNGLKPVNENLPKRVKVVNLLSNHLNLVTSYNKIYKMGTFGATVTMKTSDLEDILSDQKYRKQAEEGFFYICDEAIVEDNDLTDFYETINDKSAIEHIISLKEDSCVDMFLSLSDTMKESVSSAMAEELIKGKFLDKNRLSTIQIKTGIDIEEMAEIIKQAKK